MTSEQVMTLLVAAAFSTSHLLSRAAGSLGATPRSGWLSAAGGVSVAYVFVHLLPELAGHQRAVETASGGMAALFRAFERHVYVIALAGLAAFYGLDRLVRVGNPRARGAPRRGSQATHSVFWLHLSSFAAYNVLIGYLLLHREERDVRGLAIYAIAMALHFVAIDQALRAAHGEAYDRTGRWLLAAAPLVGWLVGAVLGVSDLTVAALFAFLAGGIVLNVLKDELPEEREARFWPFALGATGYTAVVLATA